MLSILTDGGARLTGERLTMGLGHAATASAYSDVRKALALEQTCISASPLAHFSFLPLQILIPNIIYFKNVVSRRPASGNWEVALNASGVSVPLGDLDRSQRYDVYCDQVPWHQRKAVLFWRGKNAIGAAADDPVIWSA